MKRLTKVVDSKIYLSDEFFSQIRDGKLSKDQAFGIMVKRLAEMEEFYAKVQSGSLQNGRAVCTGNCSGC